MSMKKHVLRVVIIFFCMLIGIKWSINASAANEKVDKILECANKKLGSNAYYDSARGQGYCQAFVKDCYEYAGIYASSNAGSADEAKSRWMISTDLSNIPVGACVYFNYNHVAIYVGNNKITHLCDKVIKTTDLHGYVLYFKNPSTGKYDLKLEPVGWGYQAGYDLYSGSFDPTPTTSIFPFEDGQTYVIRSALSGKSVEVPSGNTTAGVQVKVWDYAGDTWQQWKAVKKSDGYMFTNAYTGQAMDIRGASTAENAVLQQYTASANSAQRFKVVAGNGGYGLINVHSGLALDLCGSSKSNGAIIDQHAYHGGSNQLWTFDQLTYTVNYNANGGSGAPAAQTKTKDVTLTLSGTKPTRTGYTFAGWNTKANGSGQTYSAAGAYTANATVTLYAQWTSNISTYTINYNANGGSGAPSAQTKTTGKQVTLSKTKPTRTGYTFQNWNTKADGTGTSYAAGANYSADANVTLYAQWAINTLNIKYDMNGGYVDSVNGKPTYEIATFVHKKNYNSGSFDPVNFSSFRLTRAGYYRKDGAEWNTKADGSGESFDQDVKYELAKYADISKESKVIVLYAQWEAAVYEVTYDANGGNNAPVSQLKELDKDLQLATTIPSRIGYVFSAWNTKADGSGKTYVPGELYQKNENLKLYAIWVEDYNYDKLISKAKIKAIPKQKYTGGEIEPWTVVTLNKKTLIRDEDYKVSYSNNIATGKATVTVTGIGEYIGAKETSFNIVGVALSKAKVSGIVAKQYTGEEQTQDITLKVNGKVLQEDIDYTVAYAKNTNVGTATMILTGKNGYMGTVKKTFKITAYDLAKDTENLVEGVPSDLSVTYEKGGCKPNVNLTFTGQELVPGKDYTISYTNNKGVGRTTDKKKPTIVLKGKGNFKGSLKIAFNINEKDLGDADSGVEIYVSDVEYNAKTNKYKSTPVLLDSNGKKLVAGVDYEKNIIYTRTNGTELSADSYVAPGTTIVVKVTGKGNYIGVITATYQVKGYQYDSGEKVTAATDETEDGFTDDRIDTEIPSTEEEPVEEVPVEEDAPVEDPPAEDITEEETPGEETPEEETSEAETPAEDQSGEEPVEDSTTDGSDEKI